MAKKAIKHSSKKNKKSATKQMGSLEKFRRMATVIQDSNDAITFQDLEGNILAWNRGAEIIYGYSQEEALRMNIVDTVPTEYQEEARAFLASLKRGELVPNLETKRKTKNGKIVDVWLINTKLTDNKGKLTGIATTERDITGRKQSEASLREKFRELDYLREGQIALSERMRGEQIISRLAQSILSHLVPFTAAQVGAFYVLCDVKKLQLVSSYAQSDAATMEKYINFGQGLIGQVAIEKTSLIIKDLPPTYFKKITSALGELIPRSLLICPILFEDEIIGVIELGSVHEFTEHQRAFLDHVSENIGIALNTSGVRKKIQKLLESLEQQKEILNEKNEALKKTQVLLEEKAKEVQKASQYKTEFLANMSHELRTPLSSSLILAKLLMENAKENLTEEQIQFAASIYSSGNDLLNLINDILDLSKVEAGKLDIRVEKVFFPKVIDSLKQTFQTIASEKNLILDIKQEMDMPPSFLTDRQRLDQILKNLISNALKFTEVGSVHVRLFRHSRGKIAFEVTDSGIGIIENQQEIIFEAFRQADGTTNRKYGGTGLGLSISKDLAKLLGGSIEVKSIAGQGSSFTLILPEVFQESIEAAPDNDIIQTRYSHKTKPLPFEDDRSSMNKVGRTILVIEDDIPFAKIILDFAQKLEYKCIVGQGADEGFEMALEYLPDGIILDMKLPDHLGLTVLDRLKENPITRHIPVYVISVEDYAETALEMGAIGFMLKPFKSEEIKNALKKIDEKCSQTIHRVLIVEKNKEFQKTVSELISDDGIEITTTSSAENAVSKIKNIKFDCIVMGLKLSDMSGRELLEKIIEENITSIPPVVLYTGNSIPQEDESNLKSHSKSITLKGAKSPESLLNEVSLFLHTKDSKMSAKHRQILKSVRNREQIFEGKKILLVDDDIRNIFALTSALEQKGATILVGRNGYEALDKLNSDPKIDLVLMDIMMPEMDGYEATRKIREQKRFAKLPIIAVTAKAMKDDQAKCLEAGTNDYVTKPVDLEKLLSLIRIFIPKNAVGLSAP